MLTLVNDDVYGHMVKLNYVPVVYYEIKIYNTHLSKNIDYNLIKIFIFFLL